MLGIELGHWSGRSEQERDRGSRTPHSRAGVLVDAGMLWEVSEELITLSIAVAVTAQQSIARCEQTITQSRQTVARAHHTIERSRLLRLSRSRDIYRAAAQFNIAEAAKLDLT